MGVGGSGLAADDDPVDTSQCWVPTNGKNVRAVCDIGKLNGTKQGLAGEEAGVGWDVEEVGNADVGMMLVLDGGADPVVLPAQLG